MAEQTFCVFRGCANDDIYILISCVYVYVIKQKTTLKPLASQVLMVKSKMCNFRWKLIGVALLKHFSKHFMNNLFVPWLLNIRSLRTFVT